MKVTVESCLEKVNNRFKLVLMAAKRAKDLDRGARAAVSRDDDKSTIVAMREISEEAISLENLENITKSNIVNRNNEMLVDDEEDFVDNSREEDIDDDDDIEDEIIDDENYDDEIDINNDSSISIKSEEEEMESNKEEE